MKKFLQDLAGGPFLGAVERTHPLTRGALADPHAAHRRAQHPPPGLTHTHAHTHTRTQTHTRTHTCSLDPAPPDLRRAEAHRVLHKPTPAAHRGRSGAAYDPRPRASERGDTDRNPRPTAATPPSPRTPVPPRAGEGSVVRRAAPTLHSSLFFSSSQKLTGARPGR